MIFLKIRVFLASEMKGNELQYKRSKSAVHSDDMSEITLNAIKNRINLTSRLSSKKTKLKENVWLTKENLYTIDYSF